MTEGVAVRGIRGGDAEARGDLRDARNHVRPDRALHEQQVQPVAHPEPVEAGLDQARSQLLVGGLVDVDHGAAVRVRQRPDAVQRGLPGQRPGALPAAAENDQRDQPRLPDQLVGGRVPGHPDELDHPRVDAGVTQRGADNLVDEDAGRPERGRPGTQDTGIP